MKHRNFAAVLIISLLMVSLLLYCDLFSKDSSKNNLPDVFVGVDVAYDDLAASNKLIDEVSSYTNLFVIGSRGITHNTKARCNLSVPLR